VKSFEFWKTAKRARTAVLCALLVGGGLAVARAAFPTASHIDLKLADPNEGPSRITMAPAAKKAMPSVVKISVSKVVKTPTGMQMPDGMQNDPFFGQFFGGRGFQQAPRSHREAGLGSGVIVSPDGYILTNNHVIDGATNVTVTLPDRREFPGRVIGKDEKIDLAVVKIDAGNLPAITIGDDRKMQIGDAVLAIGNPLGVGETVTMGIISATGRNGLGIEKYEDFIQTDAAINPGNSGGALVNDRGELVGINTAILTEGSGGNQGIGFAVPVDLARQVMTQIVEHGHVIRSYIGVSVQSVTPAIAKAMNLSSPDGALVSQVTPGSPAQRAGLQEGDVIVGINGTPIHEYNQLAMTVSMMNPGDVARLQVVRDGQTREFAIHVEEMPGEKVERASVDHGDQDKSLAGVQVESLDAQSARQLGLPPSTKGVVVTNVDPASQAAAAGLQEGDVIQEVNRKPVTNSQDFAQALRQSHNGDSLLLINRQGNKIFLAV
jgi:serine protease Do